jgi:hypothetical protein
MIRRTGQLHAPARARRYRCQVYGSLMHETGDGVARAMPLLSPVPRPPNRASPPGGGLQGGRRCLPPSPRENASVESVRAARRRAGPLHLLPWRLPGMGEGLRERGQGSLAFWVGEIEMGGAPQRFHLISARTARTCATARGRGRFHYYLESPAQAELDSPESNCAHRLAQCGGGGHPANQ